METRTWFITGCGTGFGRALAELALAGGQRVVATDRDAAAVAELGGRYPDMALALGLDVSRPDEVRSAIDEAMRRFGGIDVLVNNAGYAVRAAAEEADIDAVRAMFEVNFFGMIDVTRAALPHLRAQGSGHIVNFSSVGGRVSGALLGYYAASKFAVEGFTAGLAEEVAEFGIRVTAIEPGAFATRFGAAAIEPSEPLAAYDPLRARIEEHLSDLAPGDPADLAAAILELVDSPEPPLQFIGGADAYAMIDAEMDRQRAEMTRWKDLTDRANTAAL